MTPPPGFVKFDLELLDMGVPLRLVLLYCRLRLHGGKHGKICPKHATLAKEIKVRSRRHVIALLNQLHQLKLIEWTRGPYCNSYRVLVPDVKWIAHLVVQWIAHPDVRWTAHLYRKEASSKEALKRGPSPPTPSSKSSRQPPDKPTSQAAGSKKAESLSNADDDSVRTLTEDPEEQFRRRLVKRHGAAVDAEACIRTVKGELEKCHGLAFADFLAYDEARTTGRTFTNPNGYYRHLARELAKQTRQQARASLRRATEAAAAAESPGRCAKCGGPGVLSDGAYCSCQMGVDLARVSRRAPPKTEKPQRAKGAA